MASPLGCPELFLFSKADYVIPHKDIGVFIDAHKNEGINVFTKCWEGSAHVRHYGKYPQEYLNEVNTFTGNCLKQYMS